MLSKYGYRTYWAVLHSGYVAPYYVIHDVIILECGTHIPFYMCLWTTCQIALQCLLSRYLVSKKKKGHVQVDRTMANPNDSNDDLIIPRLPTRLIADSEISSHVTTRCRGRLQGSRNYARYVENLPSYSRTHRSYSRASAEAAIPYIKTYDPISTTQGAAPVSGELGEVKEEE